MKRTTVWNALAKVPHRLEFLQIGKWSTRVLQAGEGSPLILMHGTAGHLETYAYNIEALSRRFRVVVYDFPGGGYTTHATEALEIPAYVEHLHGLIGKLGFERPVHIGGESLGGWVALKYAAKYPERVASLLLNTPGGTMARPEVMERLRTLSQEAADDPSEARVRARLEWLMADKTSVTDELLEIRRTIYQRPGFAQSMRHIMCLQDMETRKRNLVSDEELARIKAPTLVIWTSDDPSGPAAAGMEMARKIAGARFELIKEAGHWPQWEQVEAFNKLTLEFLDKVRTRTAL